MIIKNKNKFEYFYAPYRKDIITDYTKHMNFEKTVKDETMRWGPIVDFITEKSRTPYDHVITRLKFYNNQSSRSISRAKKANNLTIKPNSVNREDGSRINCSSPNNDSINKQDCCNPMRMSNLNRKLNVQISKRDIRDIKTITPLLHKNKSITQKSLIEDHKGVHTPVPTVIDKIAKISQNTLTVMKENKDIQQEDLYYNNNVFLTKSSNNLEPPITERPDDDSFSSSSSRSNEKLEISVK